MGAEVFAVVNTILLLAIVGGLIFLIVQALKYKKTVDKVVKIIDLVEKDLPEVQSILDEIKKDIPALGKGVEVIDKLDKALSKLPFGLGGGKN